MRKILIFKNQLGAFSETFIFQQGEAIESYTVSYLCSRLIKNGLTPKKNSLQAINQSVFGYLNEYLFISNLWSSSYISAIKKYNPSIIHCHFLVDASLIANIKKYINSKVICTVHGYDITIDDEHAKKSFLLHRKFLNYRESVKANVDLFIAVSDFIKRKLIEAGYDENKIVKHYIGVDTEVFKPNENNKYKNKLLFVGRFVEKKGVDDFLYVAKKFAENNSPFLFEMIGDGPMREYIQQYISSNSLHNVKLLGRQSQQQIIVHMTDSYAFFVPSKTASNGDSEAFGIVFIEAQAMGIPVLSYDHGGISEAVSHEKTGLLCEEGNIEKLYSNVNRLCSDTELRDRLASNCREYVTTNFNLRKQNTKLEGIYKSVIEGKL